nr:odorant receptor 2a-like [Leptinotarsa decemlineata]
MAFGYPKNFFQANQFLQKVAGIWFPESDYNSVFRIMYLLYVLFFYGICLTFFYGTSIMLSESMKNLGTFATHLGILLTNINGLIKVFILAVRWKKIRKVMGALQNESYRYVSLGESHPGFLLTKEMKVNSVSSYLVSICLCNIEIEICNGTHLLVMYGFTGISGNLATLIKLTTEIRGDDTFETTNKTCDDFLSFMYKAPFDTDTKSHCIIASIIVNLGMLAQSVIHASKKHSHDGFFIGLVICLKTQFRIIGNVLKAIRERSLESIGLPRDYSILHDESNPVLEEELYGQLSHCTEHLKILLSVRDDIENIFTFVLLIQTLASLLIFASCLYVASAISMTSADFYAQIDFFFGVFVQFSFMCWFGSEISDASENINLSLYESDWLSCSPRFRKSMIFTMIRMQRSLYFSIGKFSPLDLTTLVMVCRGSFSYYMLFKSVQ